MQAYVYNFWTLKPPFTFHDRIVQVRNATDRPLLVNAESLSHDPNSAGEWDRTPEAVTVAPGKTVTLRQADGWYLRGASTKIWAQDERGTAYRWVKHRQTAVRQVAAAGYRADKIGAFVYVLEPPAPPGSGSSAGAADTTADATLHYPTEEARMPNVKNMPAAKARQALEARGFKVDIDRPGTEAIVQGQNPEPGWQFVGSQVRLSTQGSVPTTRQVPLNLRGKTEAEATRAVQASGFEAHVVGPTSRPTRDRELVGLTLVADVRPAEGTSLPAGSLVDLYVVRYTAAPPAPPPPPPPSTTTTVPSLRGQTEQRARAKASESQLTLRVLSTTNQTTSDRSLVGRTVVSDVRPAEGTTVPCNSRVDVRMVRYVPRGTGR